MEQRKQNFMSDRTQTHLVEALQQISQRLDVLIQLSIPRRGLQPAKIGPTEMAVLELCDMTNTIADMTKKLRKQNSHITKTLTILRQKRLIASVKLGSETYFVRFIAPATESKNAIT